MKTPASEGVPVIFQPSQFFNNKGIEVLEKGLASGDNFGYFIEQYEHTVEEITMRSFIQI